MRWAYDSRRGGTPSRSCSMSRPPRGCGWEPEPMNWARTVASPPRRPVWSVGAHRTSSGSLSDSPSSTSTMSTPTCGHAGELSPVQIAAADMAMAVRCDRAKSASCGCRLPVAWRRRGDHPAQGDESGLGREPRGATRGRSACPVFLTARSDQGRSACSSERPPVSIFIMP